MEGASSSSSCAYGLYEIGIAGRSVIVERMLACVHFSVLAGGVFPGFPS